MATGSTWAANPVMTFRETRLRTRATQVDALRRDDINCRGIGEEPGLAIAQAEEGHGAGPVAECSGIERQACAAAIGEGAAVGIQDDDLRMRPQRMQRVGIPTQMVGAIERAIDKGKWCQGHISVGT